MTVEERITQLERKSRVNRALTVLTTSIALGSLSGLALMMRIPREIRSHQLSIVDAKGVVRAEIKALEGGAYGLVMRDGEGRPRASLETESDGTPRLSLATASGQRLADLTVFGDAPRLGLGSPEGFNFFTVSLQIDGSSRLEMSDRANRARAVLAAGDDGSPVLAMADAEGRIRAELSVIGDSPSLTLEGPKGSVFKAPVE